MMRGEKWKKKWKAEDTEAHEAAVQSIAAFRRKAVNNANEKFQGRSPQQWRELARSFPAKTGIGADAIDFRLIADLPDAALEEFDVLARHVYEQIAWPQQVLINYLSLLAKKQGGTRTIAIMCSFCRMLLAAAAGPLRSWDAAVALPGDTAAPNKCP